ncbi:MAG: nuclear transport factor 2 family protein [Actinomycetota bacterium]
MSNDLTEITKVLNLYIDGAGNGNADYLWSAFHESARWFGSLDGLDWDIDKDGFTAMMVEQPGNPSSARIVDIQIAGTAAIATVEEEGFWGTLSFTDFFTLAILEGRWQITCKTFAQTGGSRA